MRYAVVIAIRIATTAAWVVTGLDLIPCMGVNLTAAADLYLVAAGCVGSYWLICRANSRPVDEVYEAGKAVGRREVEMELASPRVARLAERRLTVVGD
jgi:hypothetical protein